MPDNQRPNNGPGLALPQDVAQQRAMQQQRSQQAHSMLINISTGVLCQLVPLQHPQSAWWRQRLPEESDASYQERLRAACDETATLAVQYAASLLNVLGVTQRQGAAGDHNAQASDRTD